MTPTSDGQPWNVHKFGGTSLADATRYRGAGRILTAAPGPRAAIVSAMSGVTDGLIALTETARTRGDWHLGLQALLARVEETAVDLLGNGAGGDAGEEYRAAVRRDADDLGDVLRAIALGRNCAEATQELCAGYGELWSARLLCAHLNACGVEARWIDAREVLTVAHTAAGTVVDWESSRRRLDAWRAAHPARTYVVTGYIASTADGVPTTLKRNGSDYSASIFGALLDACQITIWTDVDGVMSADPRRVPEAEVLPALSYTEAVELAYFGAKVLHPKTMAPAIERGIAIRIRNAQHPERTGTTIASRDDGAEDARAVRGLTTIDDVALVNVEGTGMVGVPGVARRMFGALESVGVSVILISQASSEHSVCFAVPGAQANTALETVRREFFAEIHHHQIETVEAIADCSILAAVGDHMAHAPGIAARFFRALAGAGVNVRAIAQGSSERNISAVVDGADSTRALRAAHSGFYLSRQTLSLGLIGAGQIGRTLLGQIEGQTAALQRQFGADVRVRAIATSRRMLLDPVAIDLASWPEALAAQGEPLDLARLAAHVHAPHLPHAVLVDCTASDAVASHYPVWLGQGIHVVTPNKRASSGPVERWRQIRAASQRSGARFLYEASVGAGLPIVATLADLVATGDQPEAVEGVLSGTLGYLFDTFDGTMPFSDLVRDARAKGYTEPDPRDDLSGMDVARKLVILAREMGIELSLEAVEVESLVPAELAAPELDADAFLDLYAAHDAVMAARRAAAQAQGHVLRYVGSIDRSGRASVRLCAVEPDHPTARVGGSDNIVAFRTRRYTPRPLIVQGPGAGPDVTAGGVFADLLRLCAMTGGVTP